MTKMPDRPVGMWHIPEPTVAPTSKPPASDSRPFSGRDKECGSPAVGGPCVLPSGHNMGQADIPSQHHWEAHQAGYTLEETAAYHARATQRIQDNARANGWKLALPDVVALDSIQTFLDRIARSDLAIFGGKSSAQPKKFVDDHKRLLVAVNTDTGVWEDDHGDKWVPYQEPMVLDPEPQPGDGPEYDNNHRAWERRQHGE